MRVPVVASVILHGAVIAAAYQLPVRDRRVRNAIEVDIKNAPPRPVPVVAPITPPIAPTSPQKMAMTSKRERSAPVEVQKPVPLQPMETQPKSTAPEDPNSPAATVPERKGPIDLRLHGIPSTGEWATPGAPPPQIAPPAAKKEWRPRGDVGDPILGKIGEKKDDYPLEYRGAEGYVYKGSQFQARISLDGSVSFDDKYVGLDGKNTGASFDLTDLIMKGKKQDPFRYEKEKFMAATAKKRAELAKRARQAQVDQSLAELPWQCEEIWLERGKSKAQKRRTLYQLWKDTDDSDDAGERARKIVVDYIRRYLPEGSPDAYTEEELLAFNRGPGRKFDPYH